MIGSYWVGSAAGRRCLVIIWVLILALCAIYVGKRVATGTAFSSDIIGLISQAPQSGVEAKARKAISEVFERRFLILVAGPDRQSGLSLANELSKALENSPLITLQANHPSLLAQISRFYRPFRYQVLDTQTQDWLVNSSPERIALETMQALYNPFAARRLHTFADDPVNLGGRWFYSLAEINQRLLPTQVPSIRQGEDHWYLIGGTLAKSPFDLTTQAELNRLIETAIETYAAKNASPAGYRMLRSGLVFHASEGAQVARQEISTVGMGSLLGITLLVLMVFRSGRSLWAIVFVLGSSSLVAVTVTLLVFQPVHLVTLAFGATLLGLAADYCFHFLAKHQTLGNAYQAGKVIRKSLIICALTSASAYLIQLFSPFPGLHQFAVFCASGLMAACCAVMVLSLFYRSHYRAGFSSVLAFYDYRIAPLYRRLASVPRASLSATVLLTLVSAFAVYCAGTSDDLRLLNTSGKALLTSEQQVRNLLGGVDSQRYFIVKGRSEQERLQRMEELTSRLADRENIRLRSTIELIPSLAQQQRNYDLVKQKLFGPRGAIVILCQQLGMKCSDEMLAMPVFSDNLTTADFPTRLTKIWPVTGLFDKDFSLVFTEIEKAVANEKTIADGKSANNNNEVLFTQSDESIRYIDHVSHLSNLLSTFRSEVTNLLCIFVLMLAAFMLLCFGKKGIAVILAIFCSGSLGLALAAPSGISLFHVMALLLVIGIAVDTAVFYIEPGLNSATWLASTLACLTSLLAFGLLSLSRVPVLQQFGAVVFFGLFCLWLVTPLIFFSLRILAPATARPDVASQRVKDNNG